MGGWMGAEQPAHENLRELGLVSLEKRWLCGDLLVAFQHLQRSCQEDGARLSTQCCMVGRHNRNKVKLEVRAGY